MPKKSQFQNHAIRYNDVNDKCYDALTVCAIFFTLLSISTIYFKVDFNFQSNELENSKYGQKSGEK